MNSNLDKVKLSLIKRKRQEALFRFYGLIGIISAILFLIIILYSVISQGQKAFFTTFIKVEVYFDTEIIDPGVEALLEACAWNPSSPTSSPEILITSPTV